MTRLPLFIISIIITFIAIFISILYCTNKKFRSLPFYFNMMFTFSIAVNNIIRLLPGSDKDNLEKNQFDTKKTIICEIQAFSLTFLDKYMLSLMTVYSIIAYLGSYRFDLFKKYEKRIFITLTIISIIISAFCTCLFFFYEERSKKSEYCYVSTYNAFKKWVDSIVTSILFLINLFCIVRILMKISELRREVNETSDGKKNGFDSHLCRFILDLIINIIVFGYVLILINKLLPKFWGKDLIYIILCLVVELFFTINTTLLRYITCRKEEENMMARQTQRAGTMSVLNEEDDEDNKSFFNN